LIAVQFLRIGVVRRSWPNEPVALVDAANVLKRGAEG
jgi:hypothetical protein